MTQFVNYNANGAGQGGFWGPVSDWVNAEQAFRGGASYTVPGGQSLYLVALAPAGQAPQTLGYAHRLPGDEARQVLLGYQYGQELPGGGMTTVGELFGLVLQLQQKARATGFPVKVWATATDDRSWVFYYDTSKAPE